MNTRAAIFAGIAAGIISTIAQMALWALFSDAVMATLLRDAHFAAAIVMGQDVLQPLTSFDMRVMGVAGFIHFSLSIAYGLILSSLISRLSTWQSMAGGAAFGLAVYAVNMHGFTVFFPWFEATRDWITVFAHIVFGIAAASAYRLFSARRFLAERSR